MPSGFRYHALRISGILLVLLGILHLAVTPTIASFVRRATLPAYSAWLTPPMLLNHVVVGVLLLPLGVLTAYAAPHAARGAGWALMVVRSTALAVAALPVTLFWLMGRRYFAAVPFQVATGIVCVGAVLVVLAAFWPMRPGAEVAGSKRGR